GIGTRKKHSAALVQTKDDGEKKQTNGFGVVAAFGAETSLLAEFIGEALAPIPCAALRRAVEAQIKDAVERPGNVAEEQEQQEDARDQQQPVQGRRRAAEAAEPLEEPVEQLQEPRFGRLRVELGPGQDVRQLFVNPLVVRMRRRSRGRRWPCD